MNDDLDRLTYKIGTLERRIDELNMLFRNISQRLFLILVAVLAGNIAINEGSGIRALLETFTP